MGYQLIGPFTQLITLRHLALRGALHDDQLEIISKGGLLLNENKIQAVGSFEELLSEAKGQNATIYPVEPNCVALPGMIDAHTHISFGGSRAKDYALRNSGKSYEEIAKAGGGIWDTVQETRKQSLHGLAEMTAARANRLLREGITTIEVKSGYGLSVEEEEKILKAIQQAQSLTEATLIPTCLAAHVCPKDFSGDAAAYLRLLSEELLPRVKQQSLAKRIDAFVDDIAFKPSLAKVYLMQAKAMGFEVTLHADQFSTGGSDLAIELRAVSADHLEVSREAEIRALAASEVVAIALPGASMGLGCEFTPARHLLDAGAMVAIASDWNPGSAPMGDLMVQASILATFQKLSNAEVWAGLTFRAAHALRLPDRGKLEKGLLADFICFPVNDYREITYQQGKLKPSMVWKHGKKIV
jgi:imidazolonepropionase